MEGKATTKALEEFDPLMILRYSATHKKQHNKVHRLDALDAFNQKLVKKISVRGIQTRGLAGTAPYLFLSPLRSQRRPPLPVLKWRSNLRMEKSNVSSRVRVWARFVGVSNGFQAYSGFTISQIDANADVVEFSNGFGLSAGEATQDISEEQEALANSRNNSCSL